MGSGGGAVADESAAEGAGAAASGATVAVGGPPYMVTCGPVSFAHAASGAAVASARMAARDDRPIARVTDAATRAPQNGHVASRT